MIRDLIVEPGLEQTAFFDGRPGATVIFGTHPNNERGPYESEEQFHERTQPATWHQETTNAAESSPEKRTIRKAPRKPRKRKQVE